MSVISVYFLPETRNRSFHTIEDEEPDVDYQDLSVIENQNSNGFTNGSFRDDQTDDLQTRF
jgi:hypothetical protein